MEKREQWIDLAKGLAILFVIIGHSCDRTLNSFNEDFIVRGLDRFIYGFHMALFFALSGYTSKISKRKRNENTINFVKKKFVDLIIPYSFFAILIWIGKMIFKDYVIVQTDIKDLIMLYIQPYAFLWFLYVLFEMEIIAYLFEKLKCSGPVKALILVAAQIVSLFIETGYRSIDKLLFFLPFFFMGEYLTDKKDFMYNKKINIAAFFIFAVCSIICLFADDKLIPFLKAVTSYSGVIIAFSVCIHLCESKRIVCLEHIGQDSIYYYILHSVFISAIRVLIIKFLDVNIPLLWVAIMSCGAFVCCKISLIIIKKFTIFDFFFKPRKYINKGAKKSV